MKLLKEGNGASSWSVEKTCTGSGNGGGGCGALWQVEGTDLYETRSHDHGGGMESYITFRCGKCRAQTDLSDTEARQARQAVPHIPYRTHSSLNGGNHNDPF